MVESGIWRVLAGLVAQVSPEDSRGWSCCHSKATLRLEDFSKVAAPMTELQFQTGLGVDNPSERGQEGPNAFYNLVSGVTTCHSV